MRRRTLTAMGAAAALASGAAAASDRAAAAADRAAVHDRAPATRAPTALRLKALPPTADPRLRIDDARSPLRTGYGGSMVDLFLFEGGKFHLSAGPRLFGRTGRPRAVDPESLQYLPSFRATGPNGRRRGGAAAMLVGYGRTVDTGLAVGIDTGVVMGRVLSPPAGAGRALRLLSASDDAGAMNEVARATMLYRF